MSNLFDLVSEFSGQKNSITIPRIYIKLCGGDFTTAAVLSQLVFWSAKGKRADGYFWKSYEEIANELCEDEITVEQVRYAVKKLKNLLCDCFFVEVKRANGITTNHYRFEQSIFLERLQNLKSGKFPDTVNGKIPDPLTDPNQILTTDPTSGKNSPTAKSRKISYSEEDLKAAHWIFGLIQKLNPSSRAPIFESWANDIRLMRERDGRELREICELFRWANQDAFWRSNILSPSKLREKWDQLAIKRSQTGKYGYSGGFIPDDESNWAEGLTINVRGY